MESLRMRRDRPKQTFSKIAELLDVDVSELFNRTKKK